MSTLIAGYSAYVILIFLRPALANQLTLVRAIDQLGERVAEAVCLASQAWLHDVFCRSFDTPVETPVIAGPDGSKGHATQRRLLKYPAKGVFRKTLSTNVSSDGRKTEWSFSMKRTDTTAEQFFQVVDSRLHWNIKVLIEIPVPHSVHSNTERASHLRLSV